jgi:hypothetical protein
MNGLWAFLIVVGLCVAVVFLYRSMTSHLRKVPPTFDATQPEVPAALPQRGVQQQATRSRPSRPGSSRRGRS